MRCASIVPRCCETEDRPRDEDARDYRELRRETESMYSTPVNLLYKDDQLTENYLMEHLMECNMMRGDPTCSGTFQCCESQVRLLEVLHKTV